jgi:hypothetical protein
VEVLRDLGDAVLGMLAAWQAKGGVPPSQLIASCRECRFLAEECAALAAGDSGDTEGDVIFVALDAAAFGERSSRTLPRATTAPTPRR